MIATAYNVRFLNILPSGDEYRCKVIAYNEREAIADAEIKLKKSGLNRLAYGAPQVEPCRGKGRSRRARSASRQPRSGV